MPIRGQGWSRKLFAKKICLIVITLLYGLFIPFNERIPAIWIMDDLTYLGCEGWELWMARQATAGRVTGQYRG